MTAYVRTSILSSKLALLLLGALVTFAASCSSANGVVERCYLLPVFLDSEYRASSIVVSLPCISQAEDKRIEKAKQTALAAIEAIRVDDSKAFLELCDERTLGELEARDMSMFMAQERRGIGLTEAEAPTTSVMEIVDAGRYLLAIVEVLPTNVPSGNRRKCIALVDSDDGAFRIDWTKESEAARTAMVHIFTRRNNAREFITRAVEENGRNLTHSLLAWPFGKKEDGWNPVTIHCNGKYLWQTTEMNALRAALENQWRITDALFDGEVTPEDTEALRRSLTQGNQERFPDAFSEGGDSVLRICRSNAGNIDEFTFFAYDAGVCWFVVHIPVIDGKPAKDDTPRFRRVFQFVNAEGEFLRANLSIQDYSELLFRSLDTREFLDKENEGT